jgi:hypothetical protein
MSTHNLTFKFEKRDQLKRVLATCDGPCHSEDEVPGSQVALGTYTHRGEAYPIPEDILQQWADNREHAPRGEARFI